MNMIIFRDAYSIVHWDCDYFPNAKARKIISGKNVAKKIFHLQRITQGTLYASEQAQSHAVNLNNHIDREVKTARVLLTTALENIKNQASASMLPALAFEQYSHRFKTYEVRIEIPLTPRIAAFIGLFAQLDEISVQLKTQYVSGMLTRVEYKRSEREAAKSLRRLILDVHTLLKQFFQLPTVRKRQSVN